MLLLQLLSLVSLSSYGAAQISLKQTPPSSTKGETKTARIKCEFSNDKSFSTRYVHWYRQSPDGALERILYIYSTGIVTFDNNSYKGKIKADKNIPQTSSTFTVDYLTASDSGTYYCAYWDAGIKRFGSGTKLVVTGTSISKPTNLQILPPSPVQEGKETYICFFENFYPEVVKATWREGDKRDKVLDSVQADAFKFNETSYSASSWMTVDASDLSKKYTCEIQHEAGSNTIEFLPAGPENQDTPDCIPTPEDSTAVSEDIGGRFTHNTALLVYVVLLLKSTIYYIIILFLVYRMGGLIKPQSKKP